MANVINVEITNFPDYVYLKGIAKRDIIQLRLLSKEEKKGRKWGEPDVECISLWYKNYNIATKGTPVEYITRKSASDMFYQIKPDNKGNIKKFDSRVLTSSKKKYVTANLPGIPVLVLEPTKSKSKVYTLNGQPLPKNKYLVFLLNENNQIMYDCPLFLSPKFFVAMIELNETSDEVKNRIMRYKTASSDRKDAQYRVVAKAIDKYTYVDVGFILSYIDDKNRNRESIFTMDKIEKLLESNNIRNMKYEKAMHNKKDLVLTYGSMKELPTHFVDTRK